MVVRLGREAPKATTFDSDPRTARSTSPCEGTRPRVLAGLRARDRSAVDWTAHADHAFARAMTYAYEPDEVPKKKHHWDNDHAGLLEAGGEVVGKCPANMSLAAAEDLLNDGLPWFPHRWPRSYPQRIYGIFGGVLYRATPTNPGTSLSRLSRASRAVPEGRSRPQAGHLGTGPRTGL